MRELKILKKLMLIIFAVMIVLFIIDTIYMDYNAKKNFLDEKYSGIVTDRRYVEGKRGLPDVKINKKWIYLGMLSGVANAIQIDDSIVKK